MHRLARRCGRASRECASGSRSEQDGGGDEVASREQNSSLRSEDLTVGVMTGTGMIPCPGLPVPVSNGPDPSYGSVPAMKIDDLGLSPLPFDDFAVVANSNDAITSDCQCFSTTLCFAECRTILQAGVNVCVAENDVRLRRFRAIGRLSHEARVGREARKPHSRSEISPHPELPRLR